MVISQRAFLIELYEEYLSEASFLYDQRRKLYSKAEITWKKVRGFEDRVEAHIDGLVVGGKLALEVCSRHAAEGDFGELFAAVSVFCRQGRHDLVLAVFDQLDPGDAEKAGAIADALKYELPEAWCSDFRRILTTGDPKLAPILARALGYRRMHCGSELLEAMRRCSAPALPEIVWALGRIAHEPAAEHLLDYLRSEEEPVRSAAAVALARMGNPKVVDCIFDQAPSKIWPLFPLSLAGGYGTLAMISGLAQMSDSAECLTALGLLGDPVSVPLLISRLEPSTAAAAAIALQCLTGAGLYETVFVPDEIDEDALFESERERLKEGKQPTRGDGRPYGSTVTRLSQDPETWNNWWRINGLRFASGVRYRNGGPLSPARLIDMLAGEATPHDLRHCCFEELVTRYGIDFGFETDMPVSRQAEKLVEAAAWCQSNSGRFEDGAWYFAGHRRTGAASAMSF